MADKVLYIYVDPDLHTAVKAAAKQEGITISELVAPLLVGAFAGSQDYVTIGFTPFRPDPAHEVTCDDCGGSAGEQAWIAVDGNLRARAIYCGDCKAAWSSD